MKTPFPEPFQEDPEARITALLLGELGAADAEATEAAIAASPELQTLQRQAEQTIGLLKETLAKPTVVVAPADDVRLSEFRREVLLEEFRRKLVAERPFFARMRNPGFLGLAAAVVVVGTLATAIFGPLFLPVFKSAEIVNPSRGRYAATTRGAEPAAAAPPPAVDRNRRQLSPTDPQPEDRSGLTAGAYGGGAGGGGFGGSSERIKTMVAPAKAPDPGASKEKADSLAQDGRLLYEMGRLDEAQAKFSESAQLDPNSGAARYYRKLIAEAHNAQGARQRELLPKGKVAEFEVASTAAPRPAADRPNAEIYLGRQEAAVPSASAALGEAPAPESNWLFAESKPALRLRPSSAKVTLGVPLADGAVAQAIEPAPTTTSGGLAAANGQLEPLALKLPIPAFMGTPTDLPLSAASGPAVAPERLARGTAVVEVQKDSKATAGLPVLGDLAVAGEMFKSEAAPTTPPPQNQPQPALQVAAVNRRAGGREMAERYGVTVGKPAEVGRTFNGGVVGDEFFDTDTEGKERVKARSQLAEVPTASRFVQSEALAELDVKAVGKTDLTTALGTTVFSAGNAAAETRSLDRGAAGRVLADAGTQLGFGYVTNAFVSSTAEERPSLAADTKSGEKLRFDFQTALAGTDAAGEPQLAAKLKAAEGAALAAEPSLAKGLAVDKLAAVEDIELAQTPAAPAPKPVIPPPEPQPDTLTAENAFSTFSLNVSDVSFKLAAATLENGKLPDPASIRSEEFINAFDYRDPLPASGRPIAFAWERARYPFAHNRDVVRFSVKTAAAGRAATQPLNLVLCLDNSGSMERADRVQIIREALRVLATQLRAGDYVSVVTFARTARVWVDGLAGERANELVDTVGNLTPQGGTDLGEALRTAYATAARHYLPQGINRVVLLTDGAANLGDVEPASLKQVVEQHRREGVAFDCFGIGWEGYNDDLLETLSRNGDGRYGFVNTPEEAATEFVGQLAGALQVAASDVKVQVEFNPQRVTSYRQVGYARHQLTKEQFRDNTVDAAEIGAAEAGNGIYAIQVNEAGQGPIATVRVRFKLPGTQRYEELEWVVPFNGPAPTLDQAAPTMRLAATASAFSEWLAGSPFAQEVTLDALLQTLRGVPEQLGADPRPDKLAWMIRQARTISGK